MERKTEVDVMRGIAMLCVMLAHAAIINVSLILPFEIPIFWFISGYLMCQSNSIYTFSHIYHKMGKVFKEYVLYNGILLLAFIVIHHIGIKEIIWAVVGATYSRFALFPMNGQANNIYFFTIQNSPLWFLTSKIVIDLITIIVIRKKYDIRIVMIGALLYSMCLKNFPILLPWGLDIAGVGILFTLLGFIFNKYSESVKKLYKSKYIVLLCIVYGLCIWLNPNPNISVRYYGDGKLSYLMYIITAVIGITIVWNGVWGVSKYLPKVVIKPLVVIGKNTLPILGLHYFMYCTLDVIKERVAIEVNNTVWGICKIVLAVIMCVAFGEMEKNWHKFYKGRKRETQ